MDNDPGVTPLAILDTKWATSANGPKLLVLVQWRGLLLEDTSWELWTTLKDYHLEDKVLLDGQMDAMKQFNTEQSNTEELRADKEQTGTNLRTKRKTCRPHYLEDFVINANPKR